MEIKQFRYFKILLLVLKTHFVFRLLFTTMQVIMKWSYIKWKYDKEIKAADNLCE
jgi:hypothetical protein